MMPSISSFHYTFQCPMRASAIFPFHFDDIIPFISSWPLRFRPHPATFSVNNRPLSYHHLLIYMFYWKKLFSANTLELLLVWVKPPCLCFPRSFIFHLTIPQYESFLNLNVWSQTFYILFSILIASCSNNFSLVIPDLFVFNGNCLVISFTASLTSFVSYGI